LSYVRSDLSSIFSMLSRGPWSFFGYSENVYCSKILQILILHIRCQDRGKRRYKQIIQIRW